MRSRRERRSSLRWATILVRAPHVATSALDDLSSFLFFFFLSSLSLSSSSSLECSAIAGGRAHREDDAVRGHPLLPRSGVDDRGGHERGQVDLLLAARPARGGQPGALRARAGQERPPDPHERLQRMARRQGRRSRDAVLQRCSCQPPLLEPEWSMPDSSCVACAVCVVSRVWYLFRNSCLARRCRRSPI